MDAQTIIVFSKMGDDSILLRMPGDIKHFFSKSDLIECDRELHLKKKKKKEVVEAFERVEGLPSRKQFKMNTALDGM